MGEKDYKDKAENMFIKNSVLVNQVDDLQRENEKLKLEIEELQNDKNKLAHSVVTLGNIIKDKEELWGELEKRFVVVEKVCNVEEKAKCPMFPEYCEGSCKERVDLLALLEKAADEGKIQ